MPTEAVVSRLPTASTRNGTAILIAMCVCVMSYALAQTMLVPTVTILQDDLHTTPTLTAWAVLSATLVFSAASTPLIGRLGDLHGKRRVILTVLVVYLAGTLGALVAPNIGVLIAFRSVQGVSLGLIPLAFGIIREAMPPERVAHGLSLTSGLIGGCAGVGLVVGGLLVDNASWRWLFAVSALIIVVALVLVARFVPESAHRPGGRIDLPGALLLGLSLTALVLALTEGTSLGWGSVWVIGLFVLTVLAFVVFMSVERRTSLPLVDIETLVHRPILLTHLAALALGAAQFVLYVLVPKFAETPTGIPAAAERSVHYGFGVSVTIVGLIMVPGTLATLVASAFTTRFGSLRLTLAAGLGFVALGSILLAGFRAQIWEVVVFYGIASIGFGLVMGVLPRLINRAVPPQRSASANGVNTVARTAGGAIGSQLGIAVLISMPITGTVIPSNAGYGVAFAVAAVVALIGVAIARGTESKRAETSAVVADIVADIAAVKGTAQ